MACELANQSSRFPTGICVDDLQAACQRFEDMGCNWKKKLTDGRMREIAFLLDPDNYWVEVVQKQ